MKTKIMSCLVFISIVFFSCQENSNTEDENYNDTIELSQEELLSILFNDSSELTENEVVNILNIYLNNEIQTRQTQENFKIEKIKKSNANLYSQSRASKMNTSLYEIDIKNNLGDYTAIVSGDKRFPFVLAYFIKGNQKHEDAFSEILPLDYSKDILSNHIRYIELLKDSLGSSTLEKIAKATGIASKDIDLERIKDNITLKSEMNTRATIITNPPSDAIAGNGPFVKVSWDCGMPYNQLMAQNCSDNWLWDYRYPISSVVVATAEIMSFFKPSMNASGTNIDWEYLCQKEEIHDTSDYFGSYTKDQDDKCMMIAKLMKYIGEECGVTYQCSSSSVNFNNVISFLNRYGIYVNGGGQNMNVTTLKASIDELRPVFIYGQTSSGSGHWWIVDGYRTQVTTRGSFFPGFNVYIHANMGMGKSYTGYYLVDSNGSLTFDASFAHFNTHLKMYPDVRNY